MIIDQPSTLDVALSYAARGWRVIPVTPGKKHPPFNEWQNVATIDADAIRSWWGGRYASFGISIVQGPESGIFVIDVDVSGGKRGDDTLRYLIDDNRGVWPDTVHAITGSGGVHYYFRYPTDGREISNGASTRLGPGIDVRGLGGHVVAPPSLHPSGSAYCWEEGFSPDEIEVAEAPAWLLKTLCEPEPAAAAAPAQPVATRINLDDEGPAGRYNARTTWNELLLADGWTFDELTTKHNKEGQQFWIRPDKVGDQSANVKNDALCVHTTSIEWLPGNGKTYSKFGYYACRHHGGNRSAAASALRAEEDKADRNEELAFIESHRTPPPQTKGNNGTKPKDPDRPPRRARRRKFSTMEPEPVLWLWGERIVQGALSLLAGREGIGKSTVAYDLAASLTRGVLPGDLYGEKRGVLVVATEDSIEQTILPRLMAAGADLDLVEDFIIITDLEVETQLVLPDDLILFEREIVEMDPALVILDPLMSRLSSDLDTHKDGEVRQALEPVVAIAKRTDTAFLGLIHVNKTSTTDPLNMVMGSRAFPAVARSVLFCALDPENESQRVLGLAKSNLGPLEAGTLKFAIETKNLGRFKPTHKKDVTSSKIVWRGEVAQSIKEVLEAASEDPEIHTAMVEAGDWIVEFLQARGGTYASADVKEQGKQMGHSHSALDRARKKRKVKVSGGGRGGSYWSLPVDNSLRTLIGTASDTSASDAVDANTGNRVNNSGNRVSGSGELKCDAVDAVTPHPRQQQQPRQHQVSLESDADNDADPLGVWR